MSKSRLKKDPMSRYADRVLSGKEPACKSLRWACERHFRDMERDDIYMDFDRANMVIDFFPILTHWQGSYANQPFVLAGWQEFIQGSVYGWRHVDTNIPRFSIVYDEVPKKNGKTIRAAGNAILAITLTGPHGAEVYSVATKKDQAKLCWRSASSMVKKSPELSARIRTYVSSLYCESRMSRFSYLGREPGGLDGLRPYLCVYDEYHAWRDPDLRGSIQSGMTSDDEKLEYIITTAGRNTQSMCYEMHTHTKNVLDPDKPEYQDDSLFGFISSIDKDDDVADPEIWRKANPNLGQGKSLNKIKEIYERALRIPSQMDDFLRYQLNIWTKATSHWLQPADWQACQGGFDEKSLEGRKCYGGLDLALRNDLTAFVLVFPPSEGFDYWCVKPWFWCPADDIEARSRAGGVPYQTWHNQGHITATPGNATDFRRIRSEIIEICKGYAVQQLIYDRIYASQMIQELGDAGLTCVAMGQGLLSMTAPVSELDRLILCKGIKFAPSPPMSWCATNAVLVKGDNDACKLSQPENPSDKIDGMAAACMALGGALRDAEEKKGRSIYLTSDTDIEPIAFRR